jgi:hypothetical protein
LHPRKCLGGGVEGGDLAIYASFAHAAGDELRDLAAEVDNQDGVRGLYGHEAR